MIEALLCDIDGTLVQSNWLHAEAWQQAFAAMNIHLELEDIRRQIGKGGDELIPVFVPWWKRDAVKEPLHADAPRPAGLRTREPAHEQAPAGMVEPGAVHELPHLPSAEEVQAGVAAADQQIAVDNAPSSDGGQEG